MNTYLVPVKVSNTTRSPVSSQVRIKPGLLRRLRDLGGISSEEQQAKMMGIDRGTLRRIDAGGVPSGAFIAAVHDTFGLSLGEAFECVPRPEIRGGTVRRPTDVAFRERPLGLRDHTIAVDG